MKRYGFLTLLLAGLAGTGAAQITPSAGASLSLKPTYNGALVVGRVYVARSDELTGVWSSLGKVRLLKCMPRCEVVKSIPLKGNLVLSSDSGYRIVVGGDFTAGEKLSLVLRFRQGLIMNTTAAVPR